MATRSTRPGPGERGWLENMADRMEKGKGLPTANSQKEKASQKEQKKKKTAVQTHNCTGCGFEEPPQEKRKRVTDVFNWLLCDICHLWWHDTTHVGVPPLLSIMTGTGHAHLVTARCLDS